LSGVWLKCVKEGVEWQWAEGEGEGVVVVLLAHVEEDHCLAAPLTQVHVRGVEVICMVDKAASLRTKAACAALIQPTGATVRLSTRAHARSARRVSWFSMAAAAKNGRWSGRRFGHYTVYRQVTSHHIIFTGESIQSCLTEITCGAAHEFSAPEYIRAALASPQPARYLLCTARPDMVVHATRGAAPPHGAPRRHIVCPRMSAADHLLHLIGGSAYSHLLVKGMPKDGMKEEIRSCFLVA
jgi:hypothetical protein